MLYNSEVVFINKFLAALMVGEVSEIPFDTPAFYKGVDRMRDYFLENRTALGEASDEIAMLFIKNVFEGIYKRFRDAISAQNGENMSFVNPEYDCGIIKMTMSDAEYTLKRTNSNILPEFNDFVKNCTTEFCKGAELNLKTEGMAQ